MAGLPYNLKSVAPSLESNYSMALTRLENTVRKVAKQREIATAYQGVIDSYKQKGYITKFINLQAKSGTFPIFLLSGSIRAQAR